jgi:D-3-phosphoglycerate dehydrogenase / 2-oxoglutarate reductase
MFSRGETHRRASLRQLVLNRIVRFSLRYNRVPEIPSAAPGQRPLVRKVLIPTRLDKFASEFLNKQGLSVVQDGDTPLAQLLAAHADAEALIVRSETVDAAVLDALPQLKVVVRAGAGFDNIDTRYARRRNIDVMNTPGANSNAVAEEVVALALAAYRSIAPADQSTRAGKWEKKAFMGRELTGKTVGIVGLGNIGQLVARRLAGFECRLLAFDPVVAAKRAEDLGVELVTLEAIFEQADIITLHIPATEETRKLISTPLLKRLKTGAMLINCARFEVVDEDAIRALKASKKLLYCTDVYDEDAAGPKPCVDIADLMLPHLGASTQEANFNATKRAVEQLADYFKHGVTTFVVNRGVPPGLDPDYQILAYYLARVARAYLGRDASPSRIETSFYGLHEYANWLLGPVVLGLGSDFDPCFNYEEALSYLQQRGITYETRPVDAGKKYGKAITIDLIQGKGNSFRKVSVRGTIAEGLPMVSRIDDFDRLYFEPRGESVLVVYKDQPGMLAKISAVLGNHGINIDDVRAPQDRQSGRAMAVLKVNQAASQAVLDEIAAATNADTIAALHLT